MVDGSFVDDKAEPSDADCMLLCGRDYPVDSAAAEEIEEGFPYVELLLFELEEDLEAFLQLQFAVDRFGRRRGVVEIQL